MTGTERRSHPGSLGAMPARSPLSRSPSPHRKAHASSSNTTNQLANRSTLAQRTNQHFHSDAPTFSNHPDFTAAFGATPNYELPPEGLFGAPQDETSLSNAASSSSSYWLSADNRSQSVPPRIAVDSTNARSSNMKRAVPLIDTSGLPHSRRQSLMEEAEKRPTSPHITSATPTSARHHNIFTQQQQHKQPSSRSSSFHEHDAHPPHQSKGQSLHRVASPSLLNSGIGRAAVSAAQSIMDAVAGRSSPVALRSARPSQDDRNSLSDDEAGKGHGRKAAVAVGTRFTPSIHHARHQHAHHQEGKLRSSSPKPMSADMTWRASISESRRATPAAYRPRPASVNRRRNSAVVDQQPTAALGDSSDMQLPNGHKSTHSSILIGSPIVIPQARRGAVRLRPSRKRRIARQVKPQRTFRQSLFVFIATVAHFVRLLASPAEAFRRFREYCIETRIAIDDAFRDPQTGVRCYYPAWLQAYVPLLIWLGISLSSTALVITFHTQVFIGLDHMSTYLQGLGLWGKVMLGSLIFLTTFPPLPLYSTLIMLCGFTFGLWQGFIISYIAALSGAIVVFTLSRSLLREWMVGLLNKSGGLKKVVRAIEKQPKLLFLVRLAPYPYNLMNTLLASSPTLTLRTYVTCTALALPKLLIHTGLGTSIKNFAAYNGAADGESKEDAEASETAEHVKKWAGLIGAGLCFGIMIYLLSVARRAVDELDDEGEDGMYDDEVLYDDEGEGLLFSDDDGHDGHDGADALDHGSGVDMRERAGPSTLGFRNGYAPIESSPEERFRHSMRHPQPVPGPLVLPGSSYDYMASGSGSFDGSGSVGTHSIDLADKIAEMEAHAENMQFESPMHRGAEQEQVEPSMLASPKWSPMVAALEDRVDTNDTVMDQSRILFLDRDNPEEPDEYRH
ncbi:hypothetical protein PHSY_002558 [Pseudozyma hubeiensis SY62]|uniref:Golgi apparatus membrane protein TVP38 n=1 Tax=Pseudozyma hubeiensis (strain SY62) TaxID=1305764 RepID=R9PA72_PSEHS|nr:hypothetical protein PHSY_002558 [Pseudozyma hubeiensis SY62]GAC94985.1 hypothetical protein PHSY_002558 [Pseudozyma hubeiensis SY62]